jgi:hypothetical protein
MANKLEQLMKEAWAVQPPKSEGRTTEQTLDVLVRLPPVRTGMCECTDFGCESHEKYERCPNKVESELWLPGLHRRTVVSGEWYKFNICKQCALTIGHIIGYINRTPSPARFFQTSQQP